MDLITLSLAKKYVQDSLSGEGAIKGEPGLDGTGMTSIEKVSTVGLVDTYRITLTDSTTYDFTVTNGKDGEKGDSFTYNDFTSEQLDSLKASVVVDSGLSATSENPIQNKVVTQKFSELLNFELVLSGTVNLGTTENISTATLTGFYLLELKNSFIPEKCVGVLSCLGLANIPKLMYLVGSGTTNAGFEGTYSKVSPYYTGSTVGLTITASEDSNLEYYFYELPLIK